MLPSTSQCLTLHMRRLGLYAIQSRWSMDDRWNSKNRKCYPLHTVTVYIKLPQPVKDNLLSFHALTRCDTTAAFSGHGKKTCWKVFENEPLRVNGMGRDEDLSSVEQFVCHLYFTVLSYTEMWTSNYSARTTRAFRCCLQWGMPWPCTFVMPISACKQMANTSRYHLLQKHQPGKKEQNWLVPVWTRLTPVSDACLQRVICACKFKC